ncbi:serine-rich adhesin for platelets [Thrips palmi]|uniref:Serine-rich adhesin for platelets n=1 Tax=Thrips palmi TaxID=161013 RepID=A0A6P8Y3G2_THRPL|nr:serine-rich adhesin for platelets [Thrips palmi]
MLKWTVCQQRASTRTPGPGPGPGPGSSSASLSPGPSLSHMMARRSCGAAIGLLLDQDADGHGQGHGQARAARRAARRSSRRTLEGLGDKENADTPEQAFSPRNVFLALRDVSNQATPTERLSLGLKTPESGKKRSRSQCRDITNIANAARTSLEAPRSRSSGSGSGRLSMPTAMPITPESKRSRSRRTVTIQPYEDQGDEEPMQAWAAHAAQPSLEAQVATLKYLPRQRTTSSGVARIRQSRELAKSAPKSRGVKQCSRSAGPLGRRHRRRKSSGQHAATPRFVRPSVETAADAARCAVVVPLGTTKETVVDHVRPATSPKTCQPPSPAAAVEPAVTAMVPGVPAEDEKDASPGETLLKMLDRVAAEQMDASCTASPMAIEYSPCPLRSTQSLLALRRRLFDSSVLEPSADTGRLVHTDHQDRQDHADRVPPPPSALPLTTPLIAAFNRWHRLRDTAHLADADMEGSPATPTAPQHAGVARTRHSLASPSAVSPLACRLTWLRLQAQRDMDPTQCATQCATQCPFPPFGHDGRYLSVDAPQPSPLRHASSPQLNHCPLTARRRRMSGCGVAADAPAFRVPCTPTPGVADTNKRSRCSAASSSTLSLLNHGPASTASLCSSSLSSLFPGYRPPSIACSTASSLSDIPALSSPLGDVNASTLSLLRRQRCVRRRRRTTLSDAAGIAEALDCSRRSPRSPLSPLSAAVSCPNIPGETDDAESISPRGLSSSGYSSSTTATLGRPTSSTSTVSSHGIDAPSASTTASSARSRRYGLTLPTGIPSPESPEDRTMSCRTAESTTLLDPNFMCSTPLLPRSALASLPNAKSVSMADKLASLDAAHATDRADLADADLADADFASASLLVNRGTPQTDDTWDSHRVEKVVQTPVARDDSDDGESDEGSDDYAAPSPYALVDRRCRSRKGLLFASPGANGAVSLDLDLGDAAFTPSSGSSSSCASSTSSCRSRRKSCNWRNRSCKEVVLPGELELNICASDDQLTVHVVRGNGLRRPGGDSCNAYVKVSLVAGATEEKTFRRTCVHRDSSQPFFDHKFSFEVHEADLEKRVLISVWHRDRDKRRSEFLGCMSFAVKHAVKKEVSGTFRLLPQAAGRSQNAPVETPCAAIQASQSASQSASQVAVQPADASHGQERAERRRAMFSSRTMESVAANTSTTATVDRSEDSTFLRHLELEPTGPDGTLPPLPPLPQLPQATPRPPGRTPFTATRRLQRASNGGFGFSVAWTQPPRVERVEPGLPAEQAGIRPGDYIIFVDKHNVVTLPEEDVLQLIRSCGNQLTLEVYRRNSPNGMVPQSKSTPAVSSAAKARPVPSSASTSSALLSKAVTASAVVTPIVPGAAHGIAPGTAPGTPGSSHRLPEPRPSTACSAATAGTAASDMGKRRLHLPQVTFSSEASGQLSKEEARKRSVYQLLSKEQSYSLALQFGVSRFLVPLAERRDLITPPEHQTLFQNIQEILRITEDVLERLIHEDGEPLVNSVAQVYMAVCPQMTVAYHRYCSGLKAADALLVNKTRNPEFMRTLNDPPVPRRRPDLTAFLHKPLEHYREILKLLQTIHNFTRHSDDDYPLLTKAVHEFQAAYRGLTTSSGIMEPEGEGRPLLTLQDVESRLVFTKCKPFALTSPGRRWIFGGDLVRIEGRSERRYWALLFTDLLLFAQVSRDRVLFISEEPLRLITITQAAFSVKRRATEFRLMVDGTTSPSPTGCGDAAKKTKKGDRRRTIVLRAASAEHKAVWQNLIQRQIIYLNTVRGGTPAGSPLDSPDPPSLSLTTADSMRDGLPLRRPPQDTSRSSSAVEELIEHRCRQLGKSAGSKGSALHLARWMRGQLGEYEGLDDAVAEPAEPTELWSVDTLNRRSEELRLTATTTIPLRGNSRASRSEDLELSEDSLGGLGRSRSRSTTDSQVTIASGEKVPVCRKCHKTCMATRPSNNPWAPAPACSSSETPPPTCPSPATSATSRPSTLSPGPSGRKYEPPHLRGDMYYRKEVPRFRDQIKEEIEEDPPDTRQQDVDVWGPWSLMAGMSMLGGAISGDPLAPAPVPPPRDSSSTTTMPPRISVVPPTPGLPRASTTMTEEDEDAMWDEMIEAELRASPIIRRRKLEQLQQQRRAECGGGSQDTLDDSSSDLAEPPYRSLSSSCELHRYGTLNSLPDGLAAEAAEAAEEELGQSKDKDDAEPDEDDDDKQSGLAGAAVPAVPEAPGGMASSLRGWTARAGVFVAEKMAILERLGDESLAAAILDRYLRPAPGSTQPQGGEDSGTTSGGTSGEEAWGTPTSGDDDLGSPLGQEFRSFPNSPPESTSSVLTAEEEAEQLMMEELLTSAALAHRLFPGSSAAARRRLEPLVEEDESVPPADTPSPSDDSGEESSDTEEPTSILSDAPSHIGSGRPMPGGERHRVETLRKQQQQHQLKAQAQAQAAQGGFFTRLRLRRAREDLPPKDAPKRGKILSFLSRGAKSDGAGAATATATASATASVELSTLTTTTPSITAPVSSTPTPQAMAAATTRPIMSRLFSRDAVNDVPATLPRQMAVSGDDAPTLRHPEKQQSDRRFWKSLGRRRAGAPQNTAVGASL